MAGFIILGICFWVLVALAVVLFGAFVYIQCQYYHWNKTDRENELLISSVIEHVDKMLSKHLPIEPEENPEKDSNTENN